MCFNTDTDTQTYTHTAGDHWAPKLNSKYAGLSISCRYNEVCDAGQIF